MASSSCAEALLKDGVKSVLITGGHDDGENVINSYFDASGEQTFEWERLDGEYHGSGCTLASALALFLAREMPVKLALPDRKVVAVTGDAGFMMNSQEIETAMRLKTPIVVLIWNDNAYGLIEWKQMTQFGRKSHIDFTNPDFVKYAEAFGAKGYRIEKGEYLLPTLKKALKDNTVSIIDCPVDYSENLKLTAKLGEMICPV